MEPILYRSGLAAALSAILALAGCGTRASSTHDPGHAEPSPSAAHSHAHGEHGPRGGHLIELGRNHKYHVELIENSASETVTIYILGADMQEQPIDPKSVTLNLTAHGETKVFELAAEPSEPGAAASRFISSDAELYRMLAHESGVTGRLLVRIEGVPYVGRVAHHVHAGHSSH